MQALGEQSTIERVRRTDDETVYVPGRVRVGSPGDGEPGEDER